MRHAMNHQRSLLRTFRTLGLTAFAVVTSSVPVGAQDVKLDSPDVQFPEAYSFIQTVRSR